VEIQLTVGAKIKIFVSKNPSYSCFPSTIVVVPAKHSPLISDSSSSHATIQKSFVRIDQK